MEQLFLYFFNDLLLLSESVAFPKRLALNLNYGELLKATFKGFPLLFIRDLSLLN